MANLELYKIFVEVAKEQNITKASEKLNISQPAVTRHIKNLENELNTILFNRIKGMTLTASGKDLYNKISPLIEQIVDIDKSFCSKGDIILGTYGTMLSKVLGSSIAEFYLENKDSKITVITDHAKMLNNPLDSGEFDILVTRKFEDLQNKNNKYKYIKLDTIDFVLIANNNSKLSKKSNIKISDLENQIIYLPRGESNATESLKNLIEKNKLNCEIKRIDSVTMSDIIQKYDNCVGEANTKYMRQEITQGLVSVLDTNFKISPIEFGIYYRKDNSSKELKSLIKIIKKNFND